jgi:hypothetical protein
MLKLTSLAIGLLTLVTIAPNAQALTINANQQSLPGKDLQAQISVIIGGQPSYHGNNGYYRQREVERLRLERQRAAERRRARYRIYGNQNNHRGEYNNGRYDNNYGQNNNGYNNHR